MITRDRVVVAGIVAVALLVTVPGSHLLALWMSVVAARLISHLAGLALLVVAFQQWRSRRHARQHA